MLLLYYPWEVIQIYEKLLKGNKASNCLFISDELSRKLTASSLHL